MYCYRAVSIDFLIFIYAFQLVIANTYLLGISTIKYTIFTNI